MKIKNLVTILATTTLIGCNDGTFEDFSKACRIRYKSDLNAKGEQIDYWQTPNETIERETGDCLEENTLLLKPNFQTTPIKEIKIGEEIIGKDGKPKKILNKWDKGILNTIKITLRNGSTIICTKDHKFLLINGKEILARDLKLGDNLKQIKYFFKEQEEKDEIWKLVGLFISDGWIEKRRFSISGLDGHKKERNKLWVKEFCEKRKINYRWHKKYISINSAPLTNFMQFFGHNAKNKHIGLFPKNRDNIRMLFEGIMEDCSTASISKTRTLGTISDLLKRDFKILCRSLGLSYHENKWAPTKTSFGTNPIWRLTIREKREIPERIMGIEEFEERHVYDIEVEDNEIYLPENDVLVHNCEDKSIYLDYLLKKRGVHSRVVLGMVNLTDPSAHAWVEINTKDDTYILDATSQMMYRRSRVKGAYFEREILYDLHKMKEMKERWAKE